MLHPNDNVTAAVSALAAGEKFSLDGAGDRTGISLFEAVPFGHELALRDIRPGDDVVKYGEVIGRATLAIKKGALGHDEFAIYNMGLNV